MSTIAQFLRRSPVIFDKLNRIIRCFGRRTTLYAELATLIQGKSPFTFLQIGANDGISHDPFREFMIRPYARGVAVEPVPEYFKTMRRNYENYSQVIPENCAVGYPAGHLPFYAFKSDYLASKGGSKELAGLASFTREKLVACIGNDETPEGSIREILVPVYPVEELMTKHNIDHFDCLFMDCEGYEENILTHLNFERVKPKIIVYEHTHYEDSGEGIMTHLAARGFSFKCLTHDTIATHQDFCK